jgi:hypothetical protein
MNSSKLTEMRAQASNTYRSNWQPRDASEVTLRKNQMAQTANKSTHNGYVDNCCTVGKPKRSTSPNPGFSSDYSEQIVFQKKAGCANCEDPNFGKPGGVQLLNCNEVYQILELNPDGTPSPLLQNPVKGVSCYCADPGIYKQPFPVDCSIVEPSYTGSANQVPIIKEQGENQGHLPEQQYPYPSG